MNSSLNSIKGFSRHVRLLITGNLILYGCLTCRLLTPK